MPHSGFFLNEMSTSEVWSVEYSHFVSSGLRYLGIIYMLYLFVILFGESVVVDILDSTNATASETSALCKKSGNLTDSESRTKSDTWRHPGFSIFNRRGKTLKEALAMHSAQYTESFIRHRGQSGRKAKL